MLIYDSVFGNTEKIARAVGQALSENTGVTIVRIHEADAEKMRQSNLLIIGSPTRGFRPTPAVMKCLNALPKNHFRHIRFAAFDTRIDLEQIGSKALRFLVHKGGYAAGRIAKLLEKKGGGPVVPPEGFLVSGEQGPLKAGELERAASWAKQIFRTSLI
jgi:flavodoxin